MGQGPSESAGWISRVQQTNQIQIWPLWGWDQQRKDGACLQAAQEEDITQENAGCPSVLPQRLIPQSAPSLHVSDTSRITVLPLEPKVSGCEQVSLCVGRLRGRLRFLQLFIPLGWLESSLFFTTRCHGAFSSWHQYSGLGRLVWCWGPSLLQGEHPQPRYPS